VFKIWKVLRKYSNERIGSNPISKKFYLLIFGMV
jgi:hypothetical protein